MSFKTLPSAADFNNKLNSIEAGLNNNLVLKDDLTCATKSGRLFRLLGKLFSLFINVNKHIEIDRVAQKTFLFCQINQKHMNQANVDTVQRILSYLQMKTKKNCDLYFYAIKGLAPTAIVSSNRSDSVAPIPPPSDNIPVPSSLNIPSPPPCNIPSPPPCNIPSPPPCTAQQPSKPMGGLAALLHNNLGNLKKPTAKAPSQPQSKNPTTAPNFAADALNKKGTLKKVEKKPKEEPKPNSPNWAAKLKKTPEAPK